MPISVDRAKLAFGLGALIWLGGWLLVLFVPQLPDGDITARRQFLVWHGDGWVHQVRQGWWWNAAGALMAWGAVAGVVARGRGSWFFALWLLPLLGWGFAQTVGWQGELFLAPGTPGRLGDSQAVVTFERFTVPPAPDGAGRALRMRVVVDGTSYEISEGNPLRIDGWTIRPKWYGAVVRHALLNEPLFMGATGSVPVRLRDGREAVLSVNVENLSVKSEPALEGWIVEHYAVVTAHFPY